MICARLATRTRRGGVAERLKAHAWKVCMRETVSRVRIPPPPPFVVEFVGYSVQNGILPHRFPRPRRLRRTMANSGGRILSRSLPRLSNPCELPRHSSQHLQLCRACGRAMSVSAAAARATDPREAGFRRDHLDGRRADDRSRKARRTAAPTAAREAGERPVPLAPIAMSLLTSVDAFHLQEGISYNRSIDMSASLQRLSTAAN